MIKNILPKSPVVAAGVGILLGAGIGGIRGWLGVRRGEMTQRDAVAGAIKQGVLFGGVAAVSSLTSASKGGGAGLATMAVMGLSGASGGLPSLLMGATGGRGGGMGGMRGGMGKSGGGQGGQGAVSFKEGMQTSGSMLDTFSYSVTDMIMPELKNLKLAEVQPVSGSVDSEVQLEAATHSTSEMENVTEPEGAAEIEYKYF
ncbi:hypothetical protein [Halodesulfovibrio marinisediminis]|uniref:Uncharacterized protein n=1 Tax=Halodesulfovibrio marinisediminis DSM 17456 TaxID=1121457 RepID=A0A1N6FUA0_9BACT|nr:hypothetical protein [Halodesulfovibrio marinisediminis]SIN98899.1 hypothetical protein SAMN02745161_1519 [Halodesulfovibrio marinisediminis DSM 17456]